MQPVQAKRIPVHFAQCWKPNRNIWILNGLDTLTLSVHSLEEERGRREGGGGAGGEAKEKGKKKEEKKKKDTFLQE